MKEITREDKIWFAGEALVRSCQPHCSRMGAKRIGILPLDETVKPSYPTVKDGNVVRKTYASVRGRELDSRFKVLSGKEANVSAQKTLDEIKKARPMLRFNRTIFDGTASEEECAECLEECFPN